jgi:hypothetical protein
MVDSEVGKIVYQTAMRGEDVTGLYDQLAPSQQQAVFHELQDQVRKHTIVGLTPVLFIVGEDIDGDGRGDRLSLLSNSQSGLVLYGNHRVAENKEKVASRSLDSATSALWQPIAAQFGWTDSKEIWSAVERYEKLASTGGVSQQSRVRLYDDLTRLLTVPDSPLANLEPQEKKAKLLARLSFQENRDQDKFTFPIKKTSPQEDAAIDKEDSQASSMKMFLALEHYFKGSVKNWSEAKQTAQVEYDRMRAQDTYRYNHLPKAEDYEVNVDEHGYLRWVKSPDGKTTFYECNRRAGGLSRVIEPDGNSYELGRDGRWYKNGSAQPEPQEVSMEPLKGERVELHDGYVFAVNEHGSVRLSPSRVVGEKNISLNDFAEEALHMMPLFDRDGDQHLSSLELGMAVDDDRLTADVQQVVAALYVQRKGLAKFAENDGNGISLADLEAFTAFIKGGFKSAQGDEALSFVAQGVDGKLKAVQFLQKVGSSKELYNEYGEIRPEQVRQGAIGDCYFMAALASLAACDPELIRRSMKVNRDGTFTVTFAGAPNEPITVRPITDAELSLYADGGKEGVWAAIMEKAYGKYCQESLFRRSPKNLDGGSTIQEGADGGGRPERVLQLLTGKSVDSDELHLTTKNETAKKLDEALNQKPHRAVTAGINASVKQIFGKDYEYTEDDFAMGHAYSIIGFVPGPNGGTVVVRNPWGGKDGTPSGRMELTLDEFYSNFSDVSYMQN